MKYGGTLIAARDMKKSRKFYEELFGAKVVSDYGENISFDIGISLQEMWLWKEFIKGKDVILENNAIELYFEEADFDDFIQRLEKYDLDYVHGVIEHNWGQRAVRFYDPDRHIIEVGEPIDMVYRRFYESGMSIHDISEKTMGTIEAIEKAINN